MSYRGKVVIWFVSCLICAFFYFLVKVFKSTSKINYFLIFSFGLTFLTQLPVTLFSFLSFTGLVCHTFILTRTRNERQLSRF